MSIPKLIPDSEVLGLKIKPQPSGAVYVLKAKQRGTRRTVTITYGKVANLSVREVRRWAKRDLALLSQGINPNTHKKAVAEGEKTLADALNEFLMSRSIKDSTRQSYEQTIRRNLKDWLNRPITEITQQMIIARYHKIKDDVAKRKKQKQLANPSGEGEAQKAMRSLSSVLGFFEEDILQDGTRLLPLGNPCRVLKAKGIRKPLKKREGYLTLKQRLDLRDSLSRASHPEWQNKPFTNQQAIFVMVLLLSGLRKDEARLLRWEHISFDDRTITIPETKNGKAHVLPMTSKMRGLLEQVQNDSEWVFESPRLKGKPASMSRVVERVSEDLGTNFTHHDIRRTVATLLAERGLSSDQIGILLNHANKGQTQDYIQRTIQQIIPIMENIEHDLFDTDDDPSRDEANEESSSQ
ncbi:tyrosine-type recombinase/integrase [Litoricolaceae bacterium]|nr:tyrosine-type recombinase/integrase [Litorivicinaceae bacterium]